MVYILERYTCIMIHKPNYRKISENSGGNHAFGSFTVYWCISDFMTVFFVKKSVIFFKYF